MTNVVTSHDGLKWYVGGAETDDHLALGGHEPALAPFMQGLSNPDKAYVNIGAHVGTWALRMAAYNAYVYAIEGNPATAGRLLDNVLLNNLEPKVTVWNAPLWDRVGAPIEFVDVNGKATGGSTRAELTSGDSMSETAVLTDTLDRLDDYIVHPVGLISMDVEGAEARILRGGKRMIEDHRPNMLIELHEGHPGTDPDLRQQVYTILEELDYKYFSVKVSPPEEHLICVPRENEWPEGIRPHDIAPA